MRITHELSERDAERVDELAHALRRQSDAIDEAGLHVASHIRSLEFSLLVIGAAIVFLMYAALKRGDGGIQG